MEKGEEVVVGGDCGGYGMKGWTGERRGFGSYWADFPTASILNLRFCNCLRSDVLDSNYLLVMPSILLVVFVLQLAIHLANTVGAQAINDLVCPPASAFIGPFHPTYTLLY